MFLYYLQVKGNHVSFFQLFSFHNLVLKLKDCYYLELFYSHLERYLILMIKNSKLLGIIRLFL